MMGKKMVKELSDAQTPGALAEFGGECPAGAAECALYQCVAKSQPCAKPCGIQ